MLTVLGTLDVSLALATQSRQGRMRMVNAGVLST